MVIPGPRPQHPKPDGLKSRRHGAFAKNGAVAFSASNKVDVLDMSRKCRLSDALVCSPLQRLPHRRSVTNPGMNKMSNPQAHERLIEEADAWLRVNSHYPTVHLVTRLRDALRSERDARVKAEEALEPTMFWHVEDEEGCVGSALEVVENALDCWGETVGVMEISCAASRPMIWAVGDQRAGKLTVAEYATKAEADAEYDRLNTKPAGDET